MKNGQTGCDVSGGRTPSPGSPARDAGAWDKGGWRSRAACRGEDPELFFPVGSSGPAALARIAAAKAICARCPVREACLRFALDTGQDYGIWGGLAEDERRKLRPRKRRAARRQPASQPRERTVGQMPPVGVSRWRHAS